jgi:CubicO group peptidase (beta-lactamase class C family)
MKKANLLCFWQYFIQLVISLILLTGCNQTHIRDTNYNYSAPKQLGDGIKTDDIKNVNIDCNKIIELTTLILKDTFPNIHSLLIAKDNELVYENYFSGKDEYWGLSLGYAKHDASTLHDIRSISKSVVAACIDIAIQQRRIKSIDDPIFAYLPEYIKFKTLQNEKITIRHLLTMSSGIKWNENLPIRTPANNETQMERSLNPVEYVLSQPLDTIPGVVWNYNSGGIQVLAEIIKSVSGDDIDKFAEKFLFKPLGIKNYKWIKSSKSAVLFHPGKIFSHRRSFPAAASGLRLTSRDLLKFGLLYLNNGRWDDKQILTENWVNETFKTQILRENNSTIYGYSYLFWTYTETISNKTFQIVSARGLGGQRIFMNKKLNLLVVITAGNYRRNDIRNDGQSALDKYILPALYMDN